MKYRVDIIIEVPDEWNTVDVEDAICDGLINLDSEIDVMEFVDIYEF